MKTEKNTPPFVSIVIISKDRHDLLVKAVESALQLDYPRERFEIIVVEEGDEPTPLEGVHYVFLPRRNLGLGYARNTGVRHATGEIIVFTDDDCLIDHRWLKELVSRFEDPDVAGVAGATFAQRGSLIGLCEDILGFPGGGHKRYHRHGGRTVETRHLSGCNCAYRREIFESFAFEEDGPGRLGADDYLLGIAVADRFKCLYVPSAVVYHKPRGSFVKIISWFSRRRINELLIDEVEEGVKCYRSFLRRPHQVVLLRLLGLAAPPLFFRLSGVIAVAVLGLCWYGLVLAKNLPVALYFRPRGVVFLVPLVKLFMDLGVMVGEWRYLTRSHEQLGSTLDEYRR
jgi:glycosyltransferase involved in cell wall biosynthesis